MPRHASPDRNSRFPALLIVLLAVISPLFFPGGGSAAPVPNSFEEYYRQLYTDIEIAGFSDYMVFDYAGLTSRAHTVAVVTPLDDLTTGNSYGISSAGDRYYNAHSVREVELVRVFKNDKHYEATLAMAEKCALLEDGTLVMDQDCYPMQRGCFYLVFLTDSGYGYPLSLSADNGKFDLSHLKLNSRGGLLWTALLDLGIAETDHPNAGSLPSAERAVRNQFDADYAAFHAGISWEAVSVTTSFTDEKMALACRLSSDGRYVEVGDTIYAAEQGTNG